MENLTKFDGIIVLLGHSWLVVMMIYPTPTSSSPQMRDII